jgi:hypothetical protein
MVGFGGADTASRTTLGDFFIFNATTNPMTGVYIPVGSGHYRTSGAGGFGEGFGNGTFDVSPGTADRRILFRPGVSSRGPQFTFCMRPRSRMA